MDGGQRYLSPDDAAPKNKSRERTNDPDRCASGILERFAKSSGSVNCRVIAGQERGPDEKPSTSSDRGKPFQPRALVAAIFASGNWKDTAPSAQLRNLYSLFREKERERERMRRKGKSRWRNGGRGGAARSSGEHDHSETHVHEDSTFREALHRCRPRTEKKGPHHRVNVVIKDPEKFCGKLNRPNPRCNATKCQRRRKLSHSIKTIMAIL